MQIRFCLCCCCLTCSANSSSSLVKVVESIDGSRGEGAIEELERELIDEEAGQLVAKVDDHVAHEYLRELGAETGHANDHILGKFASPNRLLAGTLEELADVTAHAELWRLCRVQSGLRWTILAVIIVCCVECLWQRMLLLARSELHLAENGPMAIALHVLAYQIAQRYVRYENLVTQRKAGYRTGVVIL